MTAPVIVDTGPQVALLVVRDRHDRWARRVLDEIEPPLLTCEAVLSEICFLVHKLESGLDTVLNLLARGVLDFTFQLQPEAERIRKLMSRYASVPMSLADACLVRMAELHGDSPILTLDGDYRIYRKNGRQALALISN